MFRNLKGRGALYISPICSAVDWFDDFSVFRYDFTAFDCVGGCFEGLSNRFVLLGRVNMFWIHIVDGYIGVCPNSEMPFPR